MRKIVSEEKRQHSSKLVPYSYYKCGIPLYFTSVPLHWHTEFEMNYILSGQGEFICEDERFVAGKGDIMIFQPNRLHAVYPCEGMELYYDTLVFSPNMLGAAENDRCTVEYIRPLVNHSFHIKEKITSEDNAYEELKTSAEKIFDCAKRNSTEYDLLLKSELLHIFWLLENRGYIQHGRQVQNSRSEMLRPILEYMNENFRENLTIEQLAKRANLSKSYFMGSFKQTAGTGAMEYIIQLRVNAACEMLINTEKTSAEIAFDCGFSNLSNFNRHFKKSVGCTPNEYRKSSRKL